MILRHRRFPELLETSASAQAAPVETCRGDEGMVNYGDSMVKAMEVDGLIGGTTIVTTIVTTVGDNDQ